MRSLAASPAAFFADLEHYLEKQFEGETDLQLNAAWDLGDRYLGCGYFRERAAYDAIKEQVLKEGEDQLRKNRLRLIANPHAWQNATTPFDTNADGSVVPLSRAAAR